ncbi:helix-turn-helix transcriptional regulator [Streptomyces massasporeus]|uniref:helix-turn-helix transcriptional regulator n=1 Tax=Streptomyces massasporeus TaxID=67324 RepID=UPI00340BCD51
MSVATRKEAMAALWEFMRMPLAEGGGVAAVTGPPGTGKTYLVERFAQQARGAGAVVRQAAGVPAEQDVPLGLVKRLFGDDELVRGEETDWLPGLAHCCDLEVTRLCATCQSLALGMYTRIERSLRSSEGATRVVLVVDDLHFTDAPSLWVLRLLLSRVRTLPVFLILSGYSQAPARQLRDFRLDAMKKSSLLTLDLPLLTLSEADVLLREMTERRAMTAYMKAVMELTGGNMRLLTVVGRHTKTLAQSTKLSDSSEPVTYDRSQLRSAVELMVCNGPVTEVERVARAMAVLGVGRPAALIGALSGVGPVETANAMELIEAMGLTSSGDFRHPAIRAAILEGLDSKERVSFYRSAAQLLFEKGTPIREVADCLVAAGVAAEVWERTVLREAARHAHAAGAWHEAVNYLELARNFSCQPDEQAEVLVEVACAKWRVDVPAALSHLTELVSHARGGRLSGQGVVVVSGMLLWGGRRAAAKEILGLLSDLDRAELGRVRTLIEFPVAHQESGPPNASGACADTDTSVVLWWGDATAAVVDNRSAGPPGAFLASKEMIRSYFLDCDQPNWVMDVGYFTTRLLYHVCLALPETPCDGLAKEGSERMSPFRRIILHCLQAVNALKRGRPAEAEKEARSALAQPAGWGIHVGLPLSVLVLAQLQQGKFEDAKSTLRTPVPARLFESELGRLYLHTRGLYQLAVRMPHAAVGDFLTCGEIERRLGIPSVPTCPWQAWAAHAYLLLGRKEEATRNAEAVAATCDDVHAKAIALRVLALARPIGLRADLLRDAVGLLEGSGWRVDLASTLYELGRTHHFLGNAKAGRVLIRRAWNIARFAGFEPLLSVMASCRADDEATALSPADLGGLDGPDEQCADAPAGASARNADVLSSAERRVAWLAGIGHSNREVADRLCITVSTVEQHLTKIYRKLGLKQRNDLVTVVPIPSDGMLW